MLNRLAKTLQEHTFRQLVEGLVVHRPQFIDEGELGRNHRLQLFPLLKTVLNLLGNL